MVRIPHLHRGAAIRRVASAGGSRYWFPWGHWGCENVYMPNLLGLNTAQHPTLVQLLVNTPFGLFDYQAQKSGSTVNVAAKPTAFKEYVKSLRHNGQPLVVET